MAALARLSAPLFGPLADAEIEGLTADSRTVRPGWLFAALPGARPGSSSDGRHFIADAVARGAAAVLAPEGTAWPEGVPARPLLLDREPRRALALLAAAHAGAQPELCVAVTGTNGKTSTVDFLRQFLALTGRRAASVGSLGIVMGDGKAEGSLTTPDPVALATALARLAREEGVDAVAMEASSHGLDQFRLDGVRLAAAGLSNLTRDHLDYHGTMEAYRAAKLRLFEALLPEGAPAVADAMLDPETLGALREIAGRRRLTLRTTGGGGDLYRLVRAIPRPDGQELEIEAAGGARHLVPLALPGRFQADNALLAAGLADSVGVVAPLDLLPRLAGVRGRMELAARLPNGAAAYVDYAHTPDALARLIAALRPHTAGKLHLVFGAGGDRDPGKRPLRGEAARAADVAWVTDDNPRSEEPALIRRAILAAIPGAREVGDRAACIAQALDALGPGDVLAVAGKGHETGQIVAGGVTLPFDDAAVIRGLAGGRRA
jgi:UDP-N-acetylmuramoyl-L-alanyl-D-glutamate--2,6-diaminopimelate ligase